MTNAAELMLPVKQLIVESLNLEDVEPAEIGDDEALFGSGLELDSLDALQLAVALEERFGVQVTDEDLGQKVFASVRTIAEFIEQSSAG